MCIIKLGNVVEGLINVITGGWGKDVAGFVAKKFFDRDTCGCCERKQWLNRLTNKEYDGQCGGIKL